MKSLLLFTLNSRYTHTSIALRSLYANLKDLQQNAQIVEHTINESLSSVAESLLDKKADIIGMGVYIWNASQIASLGRIIKKLSPETIIVLGGPEVSHEPFRVDFGFADHIVQGEGEVSFYELCKDLIDGKKRDRMIRSSIPDVKKLALPYRFYSDEDIKNRYIYVEASRGCPFECEFCLSSIDEKVRAFDLDLFIGELEGLWDRGAREFKFIDRTFNLNIKTANTLLEYFLAKEEEFFVHFEVVPDHFPHSLREKIALFKKGSLQFEIGIQTLNPRIAKNISRNLDLAKIRDNIAFLEQTSAHIHLDLIIGLPDEDLVSFGKNLDELVALSGSEIQLGVLKKLSGTTLNRHDIEHGMVYSDEPPYEVMQTSHLSYKELFVMKRFARYWDLFYNSGNFKKSIKLLWDEKGVKGSVFEAFYSFAIWFYDKVGSTHQIALDRQAELLFDYLCSDQKKDKQAVAEVLLADLLRIKGRKVPHFLREFATDLKPTKGVTKNSYTKRQS